MCNELPTYTNNQKDGNRAASILKSIMLGFCLFDEIDQSQDLGTDFCGVVLNNNHPTTYRFNAQCKGTNRINNKSNTRNEFTWKIKVSTVNFWKQSKDPTFLFLVDEKEKRAYWTVPLHELEKRKISNQKNITFHISKDNCLDMNTKKLPEKFIFEIIRYYAQFASDAEEHLKNIEEAPNEITNERNLVELANIIDQNVNIILEYRNKIKLNIIERIKQDIQSSIDYCYKIDQIDRAITTKYFEDGSIFSTHFSAGDGGEKTIKEWRIEAKQILNNNSVPVGELYKESRNLFRLRENILFFLRELINEDMPFTPHSEIENAIKNLIEEEKKLYGKNQ